MKQQLSQQVLQEHKASSDNIATQALEAVPFLEMFRFCKKKNMIYMIVGSICSVIIGGGIPFFSFLWGNMTDAFKNADEMVNQALYIFIQYLLFGVLAIFAGWGMQYFWTVAGEDQANQCRKAYIDSLMRQEVGWFQTQQSSQLVSKFVADTLAFQMAIGQKVALMIYLFSMFVSGFIISITRGWELTLVVLAFLPALVYTFYLIEHYNMAKSTFYEKIFQSSSGSAYSALSSIKTVKQFNGQTHQQKRFEDQVNRLSSQSSSFNAKMSVSYGFSLFCFAFSFTLAYWYGSQCVQGTSNCPRPKDHLYTGGTVLTIFFGLILPAMNLNQLAPSLKVISEGRIAAARIYKIIDRVPLVQSPQQPKRIEQIKGVFTFQAVSFAYPKDKQRPVLQGLNMTLDCRQSGIMGESGCGKSTLLQLMMRLYDPDSGAVTLDGVDLRQLDLHWLRSQIGYVGQQPLLFSTSIRENLCVGRPSATEVEITKALKQAEAYDFIAGLSEGVDTFVGTGGNLLSGGQKQRVAIARALIKNPRIFLLDEATSALDRRNERHIHSTLGLVSSDKISITVAHSLQAILACDQVYLIEQGKLSIQGKPDEMPAFDEMPLRISMNSMNSSPSKLSMKKSHSKRVSDEPGLYSSNKFNLHLQQKCEEQATNISTYSRLLAYASGNKLLVTVGLLSAMLHGLVIPSMGIHVARVLSFNLMLVKDHDHYSNLIRIECLIMLITCLVAPFTVGLQYFCFLHLGNNIVDKIRQETYSKVLRLPLSWFQDQKTHAEQVPIMLGAGIYTMYHVITRYFAHLTVAISSIIFGLLLAFYFEWRTALVSIVLIPLIGLAGLFQSKMISGYLVESQQLYEESSKILSQTINNLKTVLSFCYQQQTMLKYSKMLDQIQQKQHSKKLLTGLFFGISFFVLFMVYGLIFYLSSLFIRDNGLQITNAFSAVFLVLFSGIIAGNNAKHIPDLGLLKVTADKLLALIDLQDEDQLQVKQQSKLINREIRGNIEFKNVSFTYSSRQEKALNNVSFKIEEGDRVGLVGESGCGKSTILKLLLGFYQCQEGEILIDGQKIEDYDVHCLRKDFGTVSQEPELFDETIQYNVAYNFQDVSKQKLRRALVKANLFDTDSVAETEEIPEKTALLARRVGPHGSHLSGGQKQRIAIARVILRDPKVLLLDEATSALDHENQERVQATLESVMHGRTTLNVTHKLTSLNKSTKILVFREGEIVQRGDYDELVRKKGTFYRLLK